MKDRGGITEMEPIGDRLTKIPIVTGLEVLS